MELLHLTFPGKIEKLFKSNRSTVKNYKINITL